MTFLLRFEYVDPMLGMILTMVAIIVAIFAFLYLQIGSSSFETPRPQQNVGAIEKQLDLHNLSHSARIWIIPNFLAPNEVCIFKSIQRNAWNCLTQICMSQVKHILALARETGWSNSPTAGKQVCLFVYMKRLLIFLHFVGLNAT